MVGEDITVTDEIGESVNLLRGQAS
jgi:hypothetical protein